MEKQISSLESYSKVFVKCARICMPVNLSAFPPSPSKQASIPAIATFVHTQNFTHKHGISAMGNYRVSGDETDVSLIVVTLKSI